MTPRAKLMDTTPSHHDLLCQHLRLPRLRQFHSNPTRHGKSGWVWQLVKPSGASSLSQWLQPGRYSGGWTLIWGEQCSHSHVDNKVCGKCDDDHLVWNCWNVAGPVAIAVIGEEDLPGGINLFFKTWSGSVFSLSDLPRLKPNASLTYSSRIGINWNIRL